MRKILSTTLTCLLVSSVLMAVLLGFGSYNATAKSNDNAKGEIKAKVFVHYPKPEADNGKIQQPVCQITTDDQVKNYGLAGWKLPSSPTSSIVFNINYNSKPVSLLKSSVTSAVNLAFQAWDTSLSNFNEGSATNINRYQLDGTNLVAWGTTPNNAIAITVTWYYPSTGQWVESDTILNKKLKWSWTPYSTVSAECGGTSGAYDLQDIMTHENGHWVGLDDLYDSFSRDLTMYGYGMTSELKKDTLGQGDILGKQFLYGM